MKLTSIIDIESIVTVRPCNALLSELIKDAGYSSRVPVVRLIQKGTVANDYEDKYAVLINEDVAASWPFDRITVFIEQ